MQLTPEIKAQLEEQKKQCIFCKLISGEMPAKKVFEDSKTITMLDIYPAVKGHTLFMTKEHYPIMPYLPADEFTHLFGLLPQMGKALKSAMISTAINVFIANGGAAGQQAPHFLMHLFPREEGDGFFNFLFKRKSKPTEEQITLLTQNFPLMMNNHFARNPASWHTGAGSKPTHLQEIYDTSFVLYEDEKALCVIPKESITEGHIEIYSKEEDQFIENLSEESSAHLFYAASFSATALFEGLGAHGTNIILKSGRTEDNEEGRLVLHVIARKQDDSLQGFLWQPKQPSYDLDGVASKIKDKTWKIGQKEKKDEKKVEVITMPNVFKIGTAEKKKDHNSPEDEILEAVRNIRK